MSGVGGFFFPILLFLGQLSDAASVSAGAAFSSKANIGASDASGRFGMVDLKALHPVETPVTLADIKAEPALSELALVRQSRLSVVPITAAQWKMLCKMAGIKP